MTYRHGILTLVIAVAVAGCGGGDEKALDRVGAGLICEDFVEDRLRSPGSTEFPKQQIEVLKADRYTVTGSVDAENGFGALLRSDYRCELRLDGNRWHLLNPADVLSG